MGLGAGLIFDGVTCLFLVVDVANVDDIGIIYVFQGLASKGCLSVQIADKVISLVLVKEWLVKL